MTYVSGNRLYVCFLYIKFSTFEFMGKDKFLTFVYAKGGFCSPLCTSYNFETYFWSTVSLESGQKK